MGLVADIDRSKLATRRYLHLQLKAESALGLTDLVFCDLPGELFEAVVNRPSASGEISELGRADHVTILIDGAKLRRLDLRQSAQRDAWLLLRGFLDSKELSTSVPVEIVFTKIDLFGGEALDTESTVDQNLFVSEGQAMGFIENVKRDFKNEFEPMGIQLTFFETAAQETGSKYELGHGIAPLLKKWASAVRPPSPVIDNQALKYPVDREIDKFCEREMGLDK